MAVLVEFHAKLSVLDIATRQKWVVFIQIIRKHVCFVVPGISVFHIKNIFSFQTKGGSVKSDRNGGIINIFRVLFATNPLCIPWAELPRA